ncbi:protein of unknown function DUF574 [Kribbella flavida DSM 17836]|uniref:S-adenosyl methyltransferase n=1 Tax=Kribbella flavida (strain DSM 17836 / JCM 10339 / NBRC 14399) TaxID=479435 RepID=D2PQA9_KRIFD|nr:SAM-dependent methyltransferase [Kribbella flavida]ADB34811.1 protein of unknown function DUF574 [Kribbella flavida DSM 17836]
MADGGGRAFLPDVDTSRPNAARVYDLLLGGKNCFEVDRRLHHKLLEVAPDVPAVAQQNRLWLGRAVELMVGEGGVDQFLDLGCGLPTAENTHQVVRRLSPDATVVYVDNDPTVITHGQALLDDERTTHFVAADLTEPGAVLADPDVAVVLDLTRPVGVLLGLVLHHVPGHADARQALHGYWSSVPSGSYLAITHPANPRDGSPLADFSATVEQVLRPAVPSIAFRTPAEIAALLEGIDLHPPGLASLADWAAAHAAASDDARSDDSPVDDSPSGALHLVLAALARKP